jgi:hypothetical protein
MEILQKSAKLAEISDLIVYDCYDWSRETKTDPEKLFEKFFTKAEGKNLPFTSKKTSLIQQLFDIIRENGGYRLAFNNLLFITTKYKFHFDSN